MKKFYLLIIPMVFILFSCERFDENVVEISGIYQANIVGISGPHIITVAYDRGDNIYIEAPFDGDIWATILVDVDDQDQFIKDLDIPDQEIGPGIYLYGDGFYQNGTIQLEYTIEFSPFEIFDFKLVGSHL